MLFLPARSCVDSSFHQLIFWILPIFTASRAVVERWEREEKGKVQMVVQSSGIGLVRSDTVTVYLNRIGVGLFRFQTRGEELGCCGSLVPRLPNNLYFDSEF